MNASSLEMTSLSLILRVQGQDSEAWRRLVKLYTPLIYRWARQCGLHEADAVDVVQDVFTSVARSVHRFQCKDTNSTFRGWLWTITRNQVRLHFRKVQQRPVAAVGGSTAQHLLLQQPDLLESDDEPVGFDARRSLVHRAVKLIRQDFQEHTWQAFWRQVIEGESTSDIAADLGMTPAAVRQAKYRVLCRLQDELSYS